MRVTLVHNPGAGDDKQPTVGQIEALIEEAGHKTRCVSAREKGWGKGLKKADLVAVAGGDGTVGKVARRLIGKGVPIAVLPLGTANNISRSLGIAGEPITYLIRTWKSARRLRFDAGIAVGPWGERYFVEGIGMGLLTCSMPQMDDNPTIDHLKNAGIKVTYAQQIFREQLASCPAIAVRATLDGEDVSGRYLMFEALNIQFIGPNLYLAPNVVRNDGKFDIVMVSEKHRVRLLRHIKNWQEGKLWPPELGARRARRLKMEWTGYTLHIDDKVWPEDERKKPKPPATIDVKVERNALEFLVPREVHKEKKLAEKDGEAVAVKLDRKNGRKR